MVTINCNEFKLQLSSSTADATSAAKKTKRREKQNDHGNTSYGNRSTVLLGIVRIFKSILNPLETYVVCLSVES